MGWQLDDDFLWQGQRPVYLARTAQKEWLALPRASRAAMLQVVKLYASFPEKFPDLKLAQEGHVTVLGKRVLLLAFKDGNVRLYGAQLSQHSPTLFVVSVVVEKKRQKLDASDARTAAKRLEKFLQDQEKEK